MNITCDVSIGELVDKLTILHIKLNNIKDENKLNDIKKEYDILNLKIIDIKDKINFYYNLLMLINMDIWDSMDKIRLIDEEQNIKEWVSECKKTIIDNDRRFRIKNKINNIMNSLLKEQKGYNLKEAIYYDTNIDTNLFIAQVRYLSTLYDMVTVYSNNTQCMQYFSDDNMIKVIITNKVNDNTNQYNWPSNINEYYYNAN